MKSIQRMGIRQTVALNLNEIEVMTTAKRHCSFCNNEHGVNTCGKLQLMGTKMRCYNLSTKDEKPMIELKERLRVTMPVMTTAAEGVVFNTVDCRFKNANFIIHEASLIVGLQSVHIENLNYRITFLDKFANPVEGAIQFWIGGHSMQTLVAHSNRLVKYVFDETIIHKQGWCDRMLLTQECLQLSQQGTF